MPNKKKNAILDINVGTILQILLINDSSLPIPFNVEVTRGLSTYVTALPTSTLKGEGREIISYTS